VDATRPEAESGRRWECEDTRQTREDAKSGWTQGRLEKAKEEARCEANSGSAGVGGSKADSARAGQGAGRQKADSGRRREWGTQGQLGKAQGVGGHKADSGRRKWEDTRPTLEGAGSGKTQV
jgi:hypothetical protein